MHEEEEDEALFANELESKYTNGLESRYANELIVHVKVSKLYAIPGFGLSLSYSIKQISHHQPRAPFQFVSAACAYIRGNRLANRQDSNSSSNQNASWLHGEGMLVIGR